MARDVDKLNFYSGDLVDKVVYEPDEPEVIVNDGDTVTGSGAFGDYQRAKVVSLNIDNPYGKRCFVRGRWSIDDGATWHTIDSRLKYAFVMNYSGMFGSFSQDMPALRAAVSIGVSDSQIKFVTANGYHGDVSQDDSSASYTPISQTFTIEYALFEVS